MKKGITYLLVVLFAFAMSCGLSAQVKGIAYAKIDTNAIRIGEQVQLDIVFSFDKASLPKGKKIAFPELKDTIRKEIEVVGKSKWSEVPAKGNTGGFEYVQKVTITSFDSGFWVIPPFVFTLEGDSLAIAETNALILEVKTVATDTAETSVRDIKPIFEEKFDWREILPYVYWGLGGLAVVAAIIIITIYLNNRKKKTVIPVPEKPREPAHITALRELERIRMEKIWVQGKYKEYYTSITDALRVYIEGRFKINAMELTTDEILQIFRTQVIDPESKNKLKQVLELADFVKFAKATPIEAENEITLQAAYDFINGTKREELPEELRKV